MALRTRLVALVLLGALTAGCGSRPATSGFDPVSFTAISPTEFWLLGASPCAHPVCPSILHTTDDGKHFAAIAAPGDTADTLRFATELDGFAFDAQSFARTDGPSDPIWQTTDRGAHWRRVPLDHVLAFATGGGFAYVVTADCNQGVCRNLVVRRAALGTAIWSSTALPVEAVESPLALAVHGHSVWLSVSPTAGVHPNQILLTSTDSGSSFTSGQSPCLTGLGGQLAATSSSVLWAVCPTGMLAGAVRSTDAGAHWTSLRVARGLANSARIAPASDTDAVIAPGGQSGLLRTTDGGASFTAVDAPKVGFWDFIGFTDATTGAGLRVLPGRVRPAVGLPPEQLVRTHDGGCDWSALAIR